MSCEAVAKLDIARLAARHTGEKINRAGFVPEERGARFGPLFVDAFIATRNAETIGLTHVKKVRGINSAKADDTAQ